jgi:hypothetical protein
MTGYRTEQLVFENVWHRDVPEVRRQAIAIWKQSPAIDASSMEERARQIVFVAKNNNGQVVAITTAYKAYVKQFRNFFYMYRCLVVREYSLPGIETKLTILTRDFLESIFKADKDQIIGMMAIVQHPKLKAIKKAVWPSTKLTYLGNTAEGHHIRVFYFPNVSISAPA